MAKQELERFQRLLLAAALVGGIAAGCGASPTEPDWQVPTPVGIVAAAGEGLPPSFPPEQPTDDETDDEWILIPTAPPLQIPTSTLSPTATPIAELTQTPTPIEIPPSPTFTSTPTPLPTQLPTETPTLTPTPAQTATVYGPSEWPRGHPTPTPTRELMLVPRPSEDLTPEQWQQLNAATTIVNFGTWGYCTGASVDPSGIVGSNNEGAVIVAAHCTRNIVGQRLPPPIIGHPAHMLFETRYLHIEDQLDAVILAYSTTEGGIAVLPVGAPLQVKTGDTLFTVTYQWDTLKQGLYASHSVRLTALGVTRDEIVFADGVDPRANQPYVTGGGSSSWLAQVQDGQLKGLGIITGGGDREADPDAYREYVEFLGYRVGEWNYSFATRIDRIMEKFERSR